MNYQDMDVQTLFDTIAQEEEELRFSDFSNNEAFRLAQCIMEHYSSIGTASIEIYINGTCKFSFFPNGTNPNNATYLRKKRRTMEEKEMSSLRMFAWLAVQKRTQEDVQMPFAEFCMKGGSFPIRLQGGSVIGAVTVSGLSHYDDHKLIVAGLKTYFGK